MHPNFTDRLTLRRFCLVKLADNMHIQDADKQCLQDA